MMNLPSESTHSFIVVAIYIIDTMERLDIYQIKALCPVEQGVGFYPFYSFFLH
jgi:hypothetical protein